MLLNLGGKFNNSIIFTHSFKDVCKAVGEHISVKRVPLEEVHSDLGILVIFDISGGDLGRSFPQSIIGDDSELVLGGQSGGLVGGGGGGGCGAVSFETFGIVGGTSGGIGACIAKQGVEISGSVSGKSSKNDGFHI